MRLTPGQRRQIEHYYAISTNETKRAVYAARLAADDALRAEQPSEKKEEMTPGALAQAKHNLAQKKLAGKDTRELEARIAAATVRAEPPPLDRMSTDFRAIVESALTPGAAALARHNISQRRVAGKDVTADQARLDRALIISGKEPYLVAQALELADIPAARKALAAMVRPLPPNDVVFLAAVLELAMQRLGGEDLEILAMIDSLTANGGG